MSDYGTEHVDLHAEMADNEACRTRGCLTTMMSRERYTLVADDGEEIPIDRWVIRHATAERYATMPIPDMMQDDHPMLRSLVPELHEVMDHLVEKPV